jgi:putative ABC transport system permease protein
MTALYSINLRIMGKSNIALFNEQSIFSSALPDIVVIIIIVVVIKVVLDLFMRTFAGKALLAVGVNEQLIKTLSVNTGRVKIVGLMISNGLAALSGSMMCQYQKFADIGMGTGTVVIGLASVIIGRALFGKTRFIQGSTAVIIGSIIYKLSIGVALKLGLQASDMKLITAVFFVIVIILQNDAWRKRLVALFKSSKGGRNA